MKVNQKENAKTENTDLQDALTDLPVAEEHAEETKGGPGNYTDWRTNFGRTE